MWQTLLGFVVAAIVGANVWFNHQFMAERLVVIGERVTAMGKEIDSLRDFIAVICERQNQMDLEMAGLPRHTEGRSPHPCLKIGGK